MRSRRRWWLLGLLLVPVAGLAWRDWPRADSRFIGRWFVIRTWYGYGSENITFDSRGICQHREASGFRVTATYRVSNDQLTLAPLPWEEFRRGSQAGGLWSGLTGVWRWALNKSSTEYRFTVGDDGDIRLYRNDARSTPAAALRRVSD